jgi:hypothetical protein
LINRWGSTLPFTPFHMGVALIVKPGLDRNFSVITFGIAQVAMDIEPGIGMLTDADVLHGPTHTLLGAIVIAMLVLLVAPSVCNYLLSRWNREVVHYKLFRELQAEVPSKRAMAIGAFFGTFSHVILDSLIHHDIQPLLPFTGSNPVQGMVTHDEVYQACVVAGVIGAVTWSAIKLARCATDVDGARAPLPAAAPPSVWGRLGSRFAIYVVLHIASLSRTCPIDRKRALLCGRVDCRCLARCSGNGDPHCCQGLADEGLAAVGGHVCGTPAHDLFRLPTRPADSAKRDTDHYGHWRRERDSNPRGAVNPHTLSRRAT